MIRLNLEGRSLQAAAFVFDKDGLLFESRQFWIALSEARLAEIRKLGSDDLTMQWARCFGVETGDGVTVRDVDPMGILAVASPGEEISATAALIVQKLHLPWAEARDRACDIFAQADAHLDLHRALKPRPGFPRIMQALRENGIPYGVATSDTPERVETSLRLFDDPQALAFVVSPRDVPHGKPHPDMLELISRRLDIPVSQLVMVGDSYVDMEMARRAGAIGIGIPETRQMRDRMAGTGAVILESLDQIRFE